MTPPMIVTDSGLTIFLNGEMISIPNDHPNFSAIKNAIDCGRYAEIPELADIRAKVVTYVSSVGADDFTLVGDFLTLNGKAFTPEVTDKVLRMIDAGQPAQPIYNFLHKVRQNPRVVAQDELLLFCVANNFMIHEDGDILAYKSVRGDYKDIHSGTMFNGVGVVVEMDRQSVDDRREVTCSTGLHFASYEYATTWAGQIDGINRRLMVMKINPADVVSIPNDYNNQKGRCWRYQVLAEITNNVPLPPKEVYSDDDFDSDFDNDDDSTLLDEVFNELEEAIDSMNYVRDIIEEMEPEVEKIRQAIAAAEAIGSAHTQKLRDESADFLDEYEARVNEMHALDAEIARLADEVESLGGSLDDFEFPA